MPSSPSFPQALAALPNWVCWRLEPDTRTGRDAKVPYNPHTGRRASASNPATWGTLAQALACAEKYQFSGIGFVFTQESGIIGLDIDHCLADGKPNDIAADILSHLPPTYIEISPSGTGLHIFLRGALPPGGNRNSKHGVEMYSSARYFTMTGKRYNHEKSCENVADDNGAIDYIHAKFIAIEKAIKKKSSSFQALISDDEIIRLAQASKDAAEFSALWRGDWQGAFKSQSEAFMNSRAELSAEDCAAYEKMNADIAALGKQIDVMESHRQMSDQLGAPTSKPLVSKPGATLPNKDAYGEAFWNVLRGRGVSNVLSIGTDTSGGYLVPEEFANQLVEALTEQNVFRKIAQIVNTSHEKLKVPIATVSGTASWMEENEAIPESDSAFGQVILQAYKLGTLMRASTELIEDSAFNIQTFIAREFARRIGVKEEEAFCIGDGIGKPTGVFTSGGAQVGTTVTGADITFDDVIDLFHSLKPPYRHHAVFLTHDNTLKQLRKLKDNNGQYLWQPAVKEGMPDTILGKPVYISPFAPEIAAGNTPIAFGDFSYYWIADRRDVRFKVLNELFAQNDQVGFYATERVDGKLILQEAVKLLKVS